jgi:Ca2+-binding EF-hand superfamily protein
LGGAGVLLVQQTLEDMSSITDKFTEQEIRDLKVVYDVYDPGDSGCVETKDIRKILKVLGFKCSQYRLQEILTESNIGRNNNISFNDLLYLVHHLQGDAYDTYQEIEQAFEFIDTDKDGYISCEDIKEMSSRVELK